MKAIKEEFPNPVLASGRDDYIDKCYFRTTLDENTIVIDTDNINIPIKYQLVCNGIQELLDSGDAAVVVKVTSSAASYSRLFLFNKGESETVISIPKYSVVKKIDLTSVIVATHNIEEFRCEEEFNDLYFDSESFEIRKGDILASEDSRTIYIDDSELEKPIASIFKIIICDDQDYDVTPNFYEDKIEIRLKKELFNMYCHFKDFDNGALRRYVTGIIVYPVLVEAIGYIMAHYQGVDGGDDYSDKRWFRAIDLKATSKGFDFQNCSDSATTIADILLGNISLDALKSFKSTLDNEVDTGETEMIGGID